MSLRIAQVHSPSARNPFLSAAAANQAWLTPALRRLGHILVDVHPGPPTPDHFDIVHLHESAGAPLLQGFRVQSHYSSEASLDPEVTNVALSWRQAERLGETVAAVLPPPIDTGEVPLVREPGDHLAFAFDGRHEYALGMAIAIACAAERPLAVTVDESTELTPRCADRIAEAAQNGVWVARIGPAEFPAPIATAAAYLSLDRGAFDMAALSAVACGTPVLAFEGTPATEVFVHGESGWAFKSTDEAVRVLGFLDVLEPKHGRSRARLVFHPAAIAVRHEGLYRELLDGNRPVFRHPELPPAEPVRSPEPDLVAVRN